MNIITIKTFEEIHESGEPMIQDTQSGFGAVIGYEFGSRLVIFQGRRFRIQRSFLTAVIS